MWHLERLVKNYRKYFFVIVTDILTEALGEGLPEELTEADRLEDCNIEILAKPDDVR